MSILDEGLCRYNKYKATSAKPPPFISLPIFHRLSSGYPIILPNLSHSSCVSIYLYPALPWVGAMQGKALIRLGYGVNLLAPILVSHPDWWVEGWGNRC